MSEYVLSVEAVLPPTLAASTDVTRAPLPDMLVATTFVVETTDELTAVLTVLLPICNTDVVTFTLAPTLMAVDTLTVAGNLAVSSVPVLMLLALTDVSKAPLPDNEPV